MRKLVILFISDGAVPLAVTCQRQGTIVQSCKRADKLRPKSGPNPKL